MDDNNAQRAAGGVGLSFAGVLTIVFIVLKLVGVISWSWFWVLSPLIFTVGLGAVVVIGFLLFLLLIGFINK